GRNRQSGSALPVCRPPPAGWGRAGRNSRTTDRTPMRYLALATDYDGTLAHHGRVDDATLEALSRLRESGRRLLLVTGREMPDLQSTFQRVDLFDRVVAENGALLYRPDTKEEKVLAAPPPPTFLAELEKRSVRPVSAG